MIAPRMVDETEKLATGLRGYSLNISLYMALIGHIKGKKSDVWKIFRRGHLVGVSGCGKDMVPCLLENMGKARAYSSIAASGDQYRALLHHSAFLGLL